MADKSLEERVAENAKPFKEKADLVDGFIDEIREKLGEEDATKINDTLVGLQSTVKEAEDLHVGAVTEQIKIKDRNDQLVQVNNDLYIKNSDAIKGKQDPQNKPEEQIQDADQALDAFSDSILGLDKK